ncbi:thiopurine S-methyltransferase [Komagataeibacter sucrofermentans DSM 15973]|nr:thiopurine S-methyltransferase [Komagataeibacter sucrofermentans DSM 15973]
MMDEAFWQAKWERGEIGFHESRPNALLTRYLPTLRLPAGARVFVPLCGMSLDIHWLLAQGYAVVGCELSRIAVTRLFAALGLVPHVTPLGALDRFEAGKLCVFVGNILDLTPTQLGAVDGVYDRAALIALPAPLRVAYASHLVALTHAAPQLLICLEYDPSCRAGPPFPVDETMVRAYYAPTFTITRVARHAVPGGLKGVCPAWESVWTLTPPPHATVP